MSDVFISYASANRDTARAIAGELEARGLSVWWDRVIPPGRQYDEVIEEHLAAARCVVVLWSAAAAASKWVRIEAGEAMRQDRLVPALVEPDVRIPLEFSRVQAADLTAWRAGEASAAFDQFFDAIVQLPAPGPAPEPKPRPTPKPPPAPPPGPAQVGHKRWLWVGAAVLVGGLVTVYYPPSPAPAPEVVVPAPAPGPAVLTPPTELFNGGIDSPLRWRDHILAYSGRLFWDGQSSLGSLTFDAQDTGNGKLAASGKYQVMLLPVGPSRIRFNMRLTLSGDSHTAGSHTHDLNLIFDRQPNGRWLFVQNCPEPNRCY